MPGVHQAAHAVHHRAHGYRAGGPAAIGDDAERAAVVAAVLHLDEGAGAAAEAVDEMAGGLAHRHDVGHRDVPLRRQPLPECG